jgi:hypothetical protein
MGEDKVSYYLNKRLCSCSYDALPWLTLMVLFDGCGALAAISCPTSPGRAIASELQTPDPLPRYLCAGEIALIRCWLGIH